MGELYEILYLDIGTIEMCENKNFLSQWRSVEGFGRETDNDIGRSIWLRGPSESTVDKPKLTRSNWLDPIDSIQSTRFNWFTDSFQSSSVERCFLL